MSEPYWLKIIFEAKDGAAVLAWDGSDDRLPFVPKVGMFMVIKEEDDEEFEIVRVTWHIPAKCWWITFATDSSTRDQDELEYGCHCKPDDQCCKLAEHLPYFLERGWEVVHEWKLPWPVDVTAEVSASPPLPASS